MSKRIYIMDCGGFIKIGVSNNPNRRKDQTPYKVRQYYCTDLKENAFEIEKRMHSIFYSKRNREAPGREYFDVQFNEAVKILMDITNECSFYAKDVMKLRIANGNKKEMEKIIVEKLKEAIPKMSDFDKGYILGKVESMADEKKDNEKESEWK